MESVASVRISEPFCVTFTGLYSGLKVPASFSSWTLVQHTSSEDILLLHSAMYESTHPPNPFECLALDYKSQRGLRGCKG